MKAIGVIGCGNMGSALMFGMLKKHFRTASEITSWDPDKRKLNRVTQSLGIRKAKSNVELAQGVRIILLAVKPQQMEEVLDEVRPALTHRPLLISVAAGIPIRWIEKRVGQSIPVVRVMPNTPALVGFGVSAIAPGRSARSIHLKAAQQIFKSVGEVVRVPERWMDAVTAVSGSGPAYFFYLMEQMIQAGLELGLSKKVARHLVIETALGAAELARRAGEDPEDLRVRVTSKGGATEAAFRVFARRHLGEVLRSGIRAAAARSKELARR